MDAASLPRFFPLFVREFSSPLDLLRPLQSGEKLRKFIRSVAFHSPLARLASDHFPLVCELALELNNGSPGLLNFSFLVHPSVLIVL